jgi:hypothetical protein
MTSTTASKKYEKKDPIEHVLIRPDMYVGSTIAKLSSEFVCEKVENEGDDGGHFFQIIKKDVNVSLALLRIFIEILSNSVDNVFRSRQANIPCSYIKIKLNKETGETSVINDGDIIFYLDCGINIFSDISPMINEITENTLLAHSDAYPSYKWKLYTQFDTNNLEYFTKLNNTYNLHYDYFQTTIMLFDTNIIENDTYDNLLNLLIEYPISITNDQGIIALYFTQIQPSFKQIKTHNENIYFYDYLSRNENAEYIMLKMV